MIRALLGRLDCFSGGLQCGLALGFLVGVGFMCLSLLLKERSNELSE